MSKHTKQKQYFRDDYMKLVAHQPDCPITPSDQSEQADRWWSGTRPSTWEKMSREEIEQSRKKVSWYNGITDDEGSG